MRYVEVAMSFVTAAMLSDRERGLECQYRVIAANKAGEGVPSNTVMAVL